MESLYELWGKRNPQWEKRYQDSILEVFSDYGKGVNKYQDARGKIFGAGYEMYILAFFIGLYSFLLSLSPGGQWHLMFSEYSHFLES